MGRFDAIKTSINANIKENGKQEITGQKINSVLIEMVDATDKQFTGLELKVEKKQDALVNGETIKTINGQSILGKGNIAIQGGEGGSVIVDSELSDTSVNPIANSAVTAALKEINEQKQDELVSGHNIKTINGQSIVGSGNIEIEGGSDIEPSNFATKDELNDKQDKISDLDSIRSGAALGATALQSVPVEYVTSAILEQEITNVENQIAGVAATIPQRISQLNNDSGFATEEYVNTQVRTAIISALNTEV